MSEFAVILVHTTSHAILAERVLRSAGLEARLVPTPRHLSSDCGSAIRIRVSDRDACVRSLEAAGVELDRVELLNE